MLQTPPAVPGMREDEIDTPALVIDLDAFEFNLDTMAALLAPTGVKLRAHAKTHKSPVIAKLQIARGAVGNCVQKVAAADAAIRMTVLVEIDVGASRCGVAPGPEAVALAARIAGSNHLIFGGLQA